ncbi:hypothetical protein C0216_11905 [Streptomyces globosus]|uniref:ABM domain-containing protein n=1 Tax=Streptomyces globosus TaxID=68209 RepID=A0A344TZJ5_9ACTN|nr:MULTISPECIES: hypothetical protein [Streptomyces]AXE24066.1 hypothetical protein C0216_11905 [Streptomyces globosus]
MGNAFVVRYEMRPETADENQAVIEKVFQDLAQRAPEGLSYASFRLADGVTFVHIAITEEGSEGLAASPAFQEFQKGFGDRAAGPPVAGGATLVGAYGFTL